MVKLTEKKIKTAKFNTRRTGIKAPVVDLSGSAVKDAKPAIPELPPRKIKTGVLDFIVISSIFLIFLLSPLFFTGLAVAGAGFEKMMLFFFLVLIGSVAWAAKIVATGGLKFKKTPLDWPIAGVLAVAVISTIMSVNQKVSLLGSYGNLAKGLAALIVFIMFYYLLINNTNAKKVKMLFCAFVASSSLVIFYSFLQLLGVFLLPIKFTKIIGFNPIGSLLDLSMFAAIILPILVLAAVKTEKEALEAKKIILVFAKVLIGAAALAGIFILVFLNGITFWPAAIAGIAVTLLFLLAKIVSISNKGLIVSITAFLLLIVFLVLGNFNIMNFNLSGGINLPREVSWNIAKSSIKNSPIFGSGPSTFYYSFSKFKGVNFNKAPFWNTRFSASSGFLFELLSDVGILGVLAVIIALIVALFTYYKAIIAVKPQEMKLILLSLFSGSIVVLILALLFPFNNSLILISVLIFALAAAAAFAESKNTKNIEFLLYSSVKNSSPQSNGEFSNGSGKSRETILAAAFLIISAGVIAALVFGAKMYLADFYARESLAAKSLDGRIVKLEKAVRFAPYNDIYYINLADSYAALAKQDAAAKNKNKITNDLSQAIKYARDAVEIAPEKSGNNEFLAFIYGNAAGYTNGGITVWAKSIEDLYDKVIELNPNSPVPYMKLALLNAARANASDNDVKKEKFLKAAIEKYNLAIAKKNDLAAAYYGKGMVYIKLKNIDEAINQLKIAVNKSGNNRDYMFKLGRLYFNRGIAEAKTLKQTDKTVSKKITEKKDGENTKKEELTVKTAKTPKKKVIERNKDINTANQIFLNILQSNNNNANSLYSLALLYNSVGEYDNARAVVNKLLSVLQDKQQKNKVRNDFKDLLR